MRQKLRLLAYVSFLFNVNHHYFNIERHNTNGENTNDSKNDEIQQSPQSVTILYNGEKTLVNKAKVGEMDINSVKA